MKIKLKSVALVEENNQFYLDAVYDKENDGIKSEIHIPRIEIPFIRSDDLVMNQTVDSFCAGRGEIVEMDIDVGRGSLFLSKTKGPNGRDVFFWEQYLEREMTVEEIEKVLGHRVKIVKGSTDV